VNVTVIMTMRATQKKMMSKPVTSTDEGRNCASCGCRFGRRRGTPRWGSTSVEKGTRADENQVSSTSASRTSGSLPAGGRGLRARGVFGAGDEDAPSWIGLAVGTALYQAGIWWPHQSWREMHQSWMLFSQWS
jgi:hypothetical protein